MKKIDVLIWGVKHIAGNHNFSGAVYANHETGETILYTRNNVPTTTDVRLLAEDLGVKDYCSVKGCVVQISLPKEWTCTIGQEEYAPTGCEMWRRHTATIGDHLGYLCEEYDPWYERSGKFYCHMDGLQAAKDACIKECQSTHNGNLYSVFEVGMEKNVEVYCCQWNGKEVADITEEELARQEELAKECEEIISSITNNHEP